MTVVLAMKKLFCVGSASWNEAATFPLPLPNRATMSPEMSAISDRVRPLTNRSLPDDRADCAASTCDPSPTARAETWSTTLFPRPVSCGMPIAFQLAASPSMRADGIAF